MGIGSTFKETCSRHEYLAPASRTAAAYSTGWVAADVRSPLFAEILVGAIVSTGTVDIKLEQASDGSGTGVKDLKTATQITDTGGDVVIDLTARLSDVDTTNSFTHVRCTVTVANAAAIFGVVLSKYYVARPDLNDLGAAFSAESL